MFSYRNFPVSAALDIGLPLKSQSPLPLPYQQRYFPVYVPSWTPALRGRNKHFCVLSDFPPNSHKKYIRPSFYQTRLHPVHRRCFPFHAATTVFQYSFPALLVFQPIRVIYGGSCFSQNGLSML